MENPRTEPSDAHRSDRCDQTEGTLTAGVANGNSVTRTTEIPLLPGWVIYVDVYGVGFEHFDFVIQTTCIPLYSTAFLSLRT